MNSTTGFLNTVRDTESGAVSAAASPVRPCEIILADQLLVQPGHVALETALQQRRKAEWSRIHTPYLS